ncbi:MAG: hypothetical protein IKK17_04415 [Oscillospiraceae bacterium]|nr:hypothetical protein [Oscillospiraceae bacterium]
MQNNTNKSSWAYAFTIASMWFGTHVGAGFATGNQVVGYFSKYGVLASLFPILAMGILAYVMYIYMSYAKCKGFTSYKDVFKSVYPKPWMEVFFEIFYIVIILAAVAGCITGAAQIIASIVGETNYGAAGFEGITWTFNIVATVGIILLCIFGVNLIRILSTGLTVAIITTAIIVGVVGLAMSGTIDTILAANPQIEAVSHVNNMGEAAWRGIIIYAAFQCVSLPTMISGSENLSLKGVKRAAVLGWIMNGGILAFSAVMLSKWYPLLQGMANAGPEVYSAMVNIGGVPTAIPNLTILTLTGMKGLYIAYNVLLFCAFISTSITLVFSMINRFSPLLTPQLVKNEKVGNFMVGAVVLALCLMIAPLGLTKITTMLYGYDGYLAVAVIFLPALIWALPAVKKMKAEMADAE